MASTQVESTIQDVVGSPPFVGADKYQYVRTTMKTWLMRQGWTSTAIKQMTIQEIAATYCDHTVATEMALKYGQPALQLDRGRRFAAAPYIPKDPSVVKIVQRKARFGTPLISSADAEETESGISETRVTELIKAELAKVKPVEVIVKVMAADKVTVVTGVKHPKLPVIAKAMAARMTDGFHPNIWLGGQTGSGKSHIVKQIAAAMKLKFYVHGAMAMEHQLMGYKDGNGKYHTTPFREAFEKGGVVLLDECDSWDPAVTLALNGPLANGMGAFADGMVMRHKDCIIVAAGNTFGAGATSEFVGRNRLDAAFMSRFAVKVQMERDTRIELAIAGGNEAWVRRVVAARARAAAAGIKHLIDPRHSQAGAALIAAGMSMDEAAELTYLAGLPEAQRRTVEGN